MEEARPTASRAAVELPEITAPLTYANYVQVNTGTHEVMVDFFQIAPGSGLAGDAPSTRLAHVARLSLPFTLLKDLRRVLDTQITAIEAHMGPLPIGSELAAKAQRKASGEPSPPAAAAGPRQTRKRRTKE